MVKRASSTSAAICIGILLLLGSGYKIRQVLNDKPCLHPPQHCSSRGASYKGLSMSDNWQAGQSSLASHVGLMAFHLSDTWVQPRATFIGPGVVLNLHKAADCQAVVTRGIS